jgi:UDP-N-acetylglucosamine--N-acetylmuramyl-(pentapeptide) pyrophosphoryl-undecaprenol N-acetylglucosamine transferase
VSREEGHAFFELDAGKTTVLVTGGSQGAASINAAMLGALTSLVHDAIQVIWLTGETEYAHIRAAVDAMRIPGVDSMLYLKPFLAAMEYALAAADVVVCRSGATTLAELAAAGVPAILVPYPFAAADHQTHNARAVVEQGAAVLCKDDALNAELLPALQHMLRNRERLQKMRTAAQALARPEAARILAEAVLHMATGRHG